MSKQKRPELVERRRAQADLNLVGDSKTRSGSGRKGCGSLIGLVLGVLGALALLASGLH